MPRLIALLVLALILVACDSTPAVPAGVEVQTALSTPTLEPTFTPSPPPADTPTPTPTDAPLPEPTPTPIPRTGLSGRVFDQESNQPIASAQVSAGDQATTTDTNGRYTLTGLTPGQYILSITHPDYDPGLSSIFTLVEGQELEVDLALYTPDTSPYPEDPMLTNPLDPNGASVAADAERLARLQGLTGEVVNIEETKLRGEYLVNYKIGDDIRAAVAEINHEVWELTDETGRQWWIIKVCGNLASPLPNQKPVPTPKPISLSPMAEVVVDELIVRSCTSNECTQVGTVPRGERVEVLGCLTDGDWCEVGWSGGRGWCTGRSLRQLAVATVIPSATPVLPTPMPTPTVVMARGEGKIVFASWGQGGNQNGIYVVNSDGSDLTRLTVPPSPGSFDSSPAWSPDKKRIVFYRNGAIYVMNADGSGQIRLTNNASDDHPTWSPDGQQIAIETRSQGGSSINIMNTDGSDLTRLTEGWTPSWSPDGTRIVFVRRDGIRAMNTDGSNVIRLTDRGHSPDWSPGGRRITFVLDGSIYVMNADGSGQTRLTEDGFQSPVWSPDNQQLVFSSGRDGVEALYIMNVDGSGLRRLIDGFEPDW